jgi:ABC-type nitrate/sulfonate/bicarbonate transport system substrate-binding protein
MASMPKKKKSLLEVVILVRIASKALSACQPKQGKAKAIKVNVGAQRGLNSALAFVGRRKGYLEEEGIHAEWNWFSDSLQLLKIN